MTNDTWQFIIGILAAIDAVYLIREWYKLREQSLWSAIVTRVYVAAIYLYDGFVPRARMEPVNTMVYVAIVLLFLSANLNHFAQQWSRNHDDHA